MFRKILTIALVLTGASLMAVAPRLDVSGGKVKLKPAAKPKGGNMYNPSWTKNKDCYIFSQGPTLKNEEWTDYEISFIPESDGFIVISVKGDWCKDKATGKMVPHWVCWDNIVVEGADIVNGDFEQGNADKPAKWSIHKGQYISKDGNKYIKTWHNKSASQKVAVKAGQKVTIKAKVKKANAEDLAAGK